MKKKFLSQIKKTFTIYDILIFLLALVFLSFVWFYFRDRQTWVTVNIKATSPQWWNNTPPPPYWLADSLEVGAIEYGVLNKPQAEIVDTQIFETGDSRKEVFLTVRLKSGYNKNTKQYNYQGQPVEIGSPIELHFGRVFVQGIISSIADKDEKTESFIVKGKVFDIYPWEAEAVKVSEVMKDGQGNIVAEIFDKDISLADYITTDFNGNVYVKKRPDKRDVVYTIKLKAIERAGNFYFKREQLLRVGKTIWLQFKSGNIDALEIMEIRQ
jgi:hypothetical protein